MQQPPKLLSLCFLLMAIVLQPLTAAPANITRQEPDTSGERSDRAAQLTSTPGVAGARDSQSHVVAPALTFVLINTATRTPTPINLGNFVWSDLSGDGQQDAGEPGVAGVTVQLWNGAKTSLLDQAVTNSSGIYQLTAPIPGDYRIRVLLPPGASFALKDQGDNTLDSDINPTGTSAGFTDVITIASNVISISHIDAGLLNVQPTPTRTRTPTATNTPTPTRTPTVTSTPTPRLYLPLLRR